MGGDLTQNVQAEDPRKTAASGAKVEPYPAPRLVQGVELDDEGEEDFITPSDQAIEMHINKETTPHELHFHDRTRKLKNAIPIAEWMKVWSRLETLRQHRFTNFDPQNETLVTVEVGRTKSGEIESKITLEKVSLGKTFKALQKYGLEAK